MPEYRTPGVYIEEISDGPRPVQPSSTTDTGFIGVLTLPEPVMVELRKHREVGSGFVFPSERFEHRPTDPYPFWYKALEEAAITDCRFHDLRHSAASYLAMGGASLLEIAEVLGHKSLQTTKRYAHLSTDHKRTLTDRVLGGILRS